MKPSSDYLIALLGCSLFAAVIVGGVAMAEGISMAQRVVTDLVMPVGLAWLIAFAGAIYQLRRGNRAAAAGFGLAFLAIGVLFSPVATDWAIAATEAPPRVPSPISAQSQSFSAVVVLGGGARRNLAGEAELGSSGERLALAAKMWHAGKVKSIICTGTAKPRPIAQAGKAIRFDAEDPAETGREILTALGVPDGHIFRSAGENTAAEMRHLKVFLQDPPDQLPIDDQLGLITSAFHLPRAMRLATAAELRFDPLPAGSRSSTGNDRGIGVLVPNAGAGEMLAIVAKEWLARIIGR